jgi:hypothetical protein
MILFISECSRSTMVLRRLRRRQQNVPGHRLEVRRAGGFREWRNVGQQRQPLRRRHRKRPQPAFLDQRDRGAGLDEAHVDVTGGQVGHRLPGLAIRHVDRVKTESLLGELHRQVLQRARAYRRVVQRRLRFLGVLDELRHGLERQTGIGHQDERRLHIERNRHEVVFRAVVDLLVQRLVDRHRGAGQHHQCVAVRRRGRNLLRRQHGRGAGLVLDHHRLAEHHLELLGIKPHQHVHAGAGADRYDNRDVLGGITLRFRRPIEAERYKHQRKQSAAKHPMNHGCDLPRPTRALNGAFANNSDCRSQLRWAAMGEQDALS